MKPPKDSIEPGLECYDPEHRVFPRLGKRGGKLSERDVLLILKWKLGRITGANKDTIKVGNLEKINRAILMAGTAKNLETEIEALKCLIAVHGIGLATASAILTVCYPNRYTIIDFRVLETLELFPSGLNAERRNDYSTGDWTEESYVKEFLPRVRKVSEQWDRGLRETDQALWGMSVNKRIKAIIKEAAKADLALKR
jgi:hypothetical protein